MQRSLKVAVALNLSVGALANYCLAGQKHKDNLVGLKCIMGTEDATSCHTECCEPDPKKCGGRDPVPSCPSDQYFGSDFASRHTSVPTGTAAEANKVCCKKKATCAAATCPAGYKADAAKSSITCASNAASCIQIPTLCCKLDADKCGGIDVAATTPLADHYIPGKAPADKVKADDAWKNTVIVPGKTPADVCSIKIKTCKTGTYTCPAGLTKASAVPLKTQLKDSAAAQDTTSCGTDDASCINKCCVADTKTCGGSMLPTTPGAATNYGSGKTAQNAPACDATKTFLPSLADMGELDSANKVIKQKSYAGKWAATPVGADAKASCCIARPSCSSYTCPAGQKKKTSLAATTMCTTTDSCATDCCQDDATTCGGLAKLHGIKCKYGFYNEMEGWTSKTTQATKDGFNGKNATFALKDTACCTPRAPCAIPGTSTPAPGVVTTTPAAAALKFSEHKIATEASQSTGSNMMWLGVGALVGMGVLMVVQGLRSSKQSTEEALSEDADALLSTVEE